MSIRKVLAVTLYHTILTFNDPKGEAFRKHCAKMFSKQEETEIIILAPFNLLSANAFNLDKAKNLSFGKELILSQTSPGVCSTNLLKTLWEKEILLVTSNFSSFHSVFYPYGKLSAIVIKSEIRRPRTPWFLEESKICSLGKDWKKFKLVCVQLL